ncbi:hypothetical protein [Neorhodopirellula lusitana]|uniref:hypothetical protein n=1 Tax=Neorhodopirellula lusitana TaxID=445327 RepID=UPI00384D8122
MRWRNEHWIGVGFWVITVLAVGSWFVMSSSTPKSATSSNTPAETRTSPASLLVDSLTARTQTKTLTDPIGWIRQGDVLFHNDGEQWREVGYVTAVKRDRKVSASGLNKPSNTPPFKPDAALTITMFEPDAWSDDAQFIAHRSTGRLDEILATLLPDPRRDAIQRKLKLAFEQHADEVTAALLPLIMQSLQASVPLIEDAITESIEQHADQIESLSDRYRDEIVQQRLIPLVRKEVMPIVRRHGEPPAEAIGREIWDKASLWRFGWRAVYDKSPLPERDLVQEEWRRFLDQEVVPTVEAHLDDIAVAVEEILKDLAANESLRAELGEVVGTIAADKDAHRLVREILNDAIVNNRELADEWTRVWTSPEAKKRLQIAGQRIEPILRELGDELMGTRSEGIQPGFARVLRNQILGKDRSWITIEPANRLSSEPNPPPSSPPLSSSSSRVGTPVLIRSKEFMAYPVVYLATDLDNDF